MFPVLGFSCRGTLKPRHILKQNAVAYFEDFRFYVGRYKSPKSPPPAGRKKPTVYIWRTYYIHVYVCPYHATVLYISYNDLTDLVLEPMFAGTDGTAPTRLLFQARYVYAAREIRALPNGLSHLAIEFVADLKLS